LCFFFKVSSGFCLFYRTLTDKSVYVSLIVLYDCFAGVEKLFKWEENGFEIIGSYVDPREALCAIHSHRPDAVFLDIRMTEMSGLEIIKVFQDQRIDIVFVVISGYGEFIYAQEALRIGAFDYC
jgi:two-component system response regulator YesN